MKTDCPACGRSLRVPDTLRGKRVKCPSCSHPFKVPEEEVEVVDDVVPGVAEIDEDDRDEDDGASQDSERERGQAPRRRRRRLQPHRGTLVLTLGILGVVLIPIIFGPIAWSMGRTDLAKMDAGTMDPEGRQVTNAGRICGIIGTILGVFWCTCVVGSVIMALAGKPPH
jgi:predicted Zn finger-like uncharacterized protein